MGSNVPKILSLAWCPTLWSIRWMKFSPSIRISNNQAGTKRTGTKTSSKQSKCKNISKRKTFTSPNLDATHKFHWKKTGRKLKMQATQWVNDRFFSFLTRVQIFVCLVEINYFNCCLIKIYKRNQNETSDKVIIQESIKTDSQQQVPFRAPWTWRGIRLYPLQRASDGLRIRSSHNELYFTAEILYQFQLPRRNSVPNLRHDSCQMELPDQSDW